MRRSALRNLLAVSELVGAVKTPTIGGVSPIGPEAGGKPTRVVAAAVARAAVGALGRTRPGSLSSVQVLGGRTQILFRRPGPL